MTYLIIGIICSFIMIISCIFFSVGTETRNNPMTAISLIFLVISMLGFFIDIGACITAEDRNPELRHQRLLRRIANDNNELQKFYIEHPEFKEQ